ncbi:hypothetical protein NDU88_012591 [Pleurodeles waltl]|uniref:Uncharacterized protein n=1 Tax=Pleurodeles waltl TaxID=8319 RepID=A0AAV7R525_PLEWA|nr:hypothetical protein NDU88_012591 [Pleurodeles waltl]
MLGGHFNPSSWAAGPHGPSRRPSAKHRDPPPALLVLTCELRKALWANYEDERGDTTTPGEEHMKEGYPAPESRAARADIRSGLDAIATVKLECVAMTGERVTLRFGLLIGSAGS